MFQNEAALCQEAEECRLLAMDARTSADRAAWLELAAQWLALAQDAAANIRSEITREAPEQLRERRAA